MCDFEWNQQQKDSFARVIGFLLSLPASEFEPKTDKEEVKEGNTETKEEP